MKIISSNAGMKEILASASRFFKLVVAKKYLIRYIVIMDLKNHYVGSFAGLFWAVIHPLLTVITYMFVFSFILKARLTQGTGTDSYFLWLLCGLAPWIFISNTVTRCLYILVENKMLITKSLFPSEILPLSVVLSNLIDHAIMLLMVFVLLLVYGKSISVMIFYLPIYLFFLLLFILGLCWFVSSVHVVFRDLGQIVPAMVGMWFFFTPIVYLSSLMPERLRFFMKLNPLFFVVEGYRLSLLGIHQEHFKGLSYLALISILTLFAGGVVFRKLKPHFAVML